MTGCDNDVMVDWGPVDVVIYADDAQGNDIIKADMPGTTLTFMGKSYSVTSQTRAYKPNFQGLVFVQGDSLSKNCLWFGEIDGAADMDEDMVLTWSDGSKNVIHYHCSDHKEGRRSSCKRSWKLDGASHKDGVFHFVK